MSEVAATKSFLFTGNVVLKEKEDGSIPSHVYTDKFELESFSYSFDHLIDRDGKVV